MLKYNHKKATDKQYAHTEVHLGTEYVGYFLPNRSRFARANENWNFVSKSDKINSFYSRTKKELMEKLNEDLKITIQ